MNWFTILLNIFECIACITGFLYWKMIRQSYWRWFPVYLAIVVLTELFGKYAVYIKKDAALNTAIYNYWGIPMEFLFFYWLFYQYFRRSSANGNKWPLYSAAIYLLCWLSEIFSWPD